MTGDQGGGRRRDDGDHERHDEHVDLAGLLRAELPTGGALTVAEHARGCESCRSDLVELALGHGLLGASRRTLGADPAAPARGPDATPAPPGELPPELRRALRRPRRGRVLVAAAAAVTLALSGATAATVLLRDDGAPPTAAPRAREIATLAPVDATGAPAHGTVRLATAGGTAQMWVSTDGLPEPPPGTFYYAWLLDPATNKMLPLGQVLPGRSATFDVPLSLVESYSAVDISLEADDGDPAHSPTSVLRASYSSRILAG